VKPARKESRPTRGGSPTSPNNNNGQRTDLLGEALAALRAGVNVLPPKQDGTKAPDSPAWKHRQRHMADEQLVRQWYSGTSRTGIGVICGAVSGGLEMLEFEGRAVDDDLHEQFLAAAHASGLGDLVKRISRGYLEMTPSGGYHLFYRTPKPVIEKLARRPATAEELEEKPDDRFKTLIETKGEGGCAVTAPSNGSVHPSGMAWTRLRGGWDQLVTLTV